MKDILIRAQDGDARAKKMMANWGKEKETSPSVVTDNEYIVLYKRDGLLMIVTTTAETEAKAKSNAHFRLKKWARSNGYKVTPMVDVMTGAKIISKEELQKLKGSEATSGRVRPI